MKGCLSHPGIKIKAVTRTFYKLEGQGLPKPSPLEFCGVDTYYPERKAGVRCSGLAHNSRQRKGRRAKTANQTPTLAEQSSKKAHVL